MYCIVIKGYDDKGKQQLTLYEKKLPIKCKVGPQPNSGFIIESVEVIEFVHHSEIEPPT